MRKEVALKRYKLIVSYENYSFCEVMEIYAPSVEEAHSRADDMRIRNSELIEHLAASNVFVSKVIKEIKVLPDHI